LKKQSRFFCDNCGAEVKKNADRCPKCGRFFASIRCPKCGFFGTSEQFSNGCPECGYSSQKKQGKKSNKAQSGTLSPLLFVLTGLFILLCAFLLSLLTK
jgi:predicted RNA-binding Zn-ribbon protein involved in translation (DUF1610 family)